MTTTTKTRKRLFAKDFWTGRDVRIALISAIVGALLTFFIPLGYTSFVSPVSPILATQLMNQEIQAAKTHDTSLVASIYSPDAVVTDEACLSKQSPMTWRGLSEITSRYLTLPQFLTLQHLNVTVTWDTGWWLTTSRGTATAETVGVFEVNGSAQLQAVTGREAWSFVSTNGQWQISSFTFGLCF